MSIISNAEKYMKRYDYLMDKRERKYKEGRRLSQEEDEELRKLRPNVFTPILMMFELLHDTIQTNQEYRKSSKHIINQSGGAPTPTPTAVSAEIIDAATAAALIAVRNAQEKQQQKGSATDPPSADADADADAAEAKRLSELEESLLPLLTKIIVYIEEHKKAEKKKDGDADEEEKYPDIGTSAKNSAILVIRRIKKWWNDLISGGTSDLSSKINLKKAIPQLANNPDDMNNLAKIDEMNKLAEKATDAIHGPLQNIEKILSNDVRDIASSSVEGIMNALSLIPGIGTTLQLWRLLQNVIVIMSKSVTTMAGAKTEGVALKTNIQDLKGDFEKMADPNAIASAAANNAMSQAPGGGNPAAAAGALGGGAAGALGGGAAAGALGGGAAGALGGGAAGALGGGAAAGALGGGAAGALGGGAAAGALGGGAAGALGGGAAGALMKGGSAHDGRKSNHLRSIKKYKREYKQSIREIRKTRKNILRRIKNMI